MRIVSWGRGGRISEWAVQWLRLPAAVWSLANFREWPAQRAGLQRRLSLPSAVGQVAWLGTVADLVVELRLPAAGSSAGSRCHSECRTRGAGQALRWPTATDNPESSTLRVQLGEFNSEMRPDAAGATRLHFSEQRATAPPVARISDTQSDLPARLSSSSARAHPASATRLKRRVPPRFCAAQPPRCRRRCAA